MPTREELMAFHQAIGGQGDPFAGDPNFASNYLASAPVESPPDPNLESALNAANAQPGSAAPAVRKDLGFVGEPAFKGGTTDRERPSANAHSAGVRDFKAVDPESDDTLTTEQLGSGQSSSGMASPVRSLGATYHPAGWDDANSPVRRETYLQGRNAMRRMGNAEQGVTEAHAGSYAEQADYQAQAEEEARQRLVQRQAAEQQRQLAVELQNRELSKAMQDAKDAKVTKEGFLERNPGSILMAIGAAFGGALSARTGQKNEALAALDNTIQTDLQLQREAANRKDKAVDAQHNLISMMRSRFGDERQADIAAEMAQRQLVASHLDRLATKAQGDDAKAKVEVVRADNDQKLANLSSQWDQMTHHKAYATGPAGGAAGGDAAAKNHGLLVQLEDGRTLMAPSDKEAQAVRAKQVAVVNLERLAKRIDGLRDGVGGFVPLTGKNADLERLGGQYILAVKEAANTGALDKGSVEFTEKMLGDPTSLFSRAGQRALGYAADARKNYEDSYKSFGAEQVQKGYAPDKSGNPAPVASFTGQRVDPEPQKLVKREAVK